MLILAGTDKTYLPNQTHPDVVQFIENVFNHTWGSNPRFRFYGLDSNSVERLVGEGYLRHKYPGVIEYTSVIDGYNSWPIQWELITQIEFSNKRVGRTVEIPGKEVSERYLSESKHASECNRARTERKWIIMHRGEMRYYKKQAHREARQDAKRELNKEVSERYLNE